MPTVYRMTVVRVDDNPDYDAQRARDYAERQARGGQWYQGEPYTELPTKEARALDVVLTAEEYEAVKRHLVGTWK